tara:strand:- start:5511 stop:5996 length:486 start_codon:yes stop_codon:yes gene_type:complete
MYTCVLNPSYTDEEFDRLFNDSWNSMSEQFGGDSQEAVRNRHRVRVKRMDQIAAVYKDGYMIAFFSGAVIDSTFKMIFALFGKTQANSKAYIHSQDFLSAISTALKTQYNEVVFNPVEGSSIDSYRDFIQPQTETLIGDVIRNETVEEEGVTYHVTKHTYS